MTKQQAAGIAILALNTLAALMVLTLLYSRPFLQSTRRPILWDRRATPCSNFN